MTGRVWDLEHNGRETPQRCLLQGGVVFASLALYFLAGAVRAEERRPRAGAPLRVTVEFVAASPELAAAVAASTVASAMGGGNRRAGETPGGSDRSRLAEEVARALRGGTAIHLGGAEALGRGHVRMAFAASRWRGLLSGYAPSGADPLPRVELHQEGALVRVLVTPWPDDAGFDLDLDGRLLRLATEGASSRPGAPLERSRSHEIPLRLRMRLKAGAPGWRVGPVLGDAAWGAATGKVLLVAASVRPLPVDPSQPAMPSTNRLALVRVPLPVIQRLKQGDAYPRLSSKDLRRVFSTGRILDLRALRSVQAEANPSEHASQGQLVESDDSPTDAGEAYTRVTYVSGYATLPRKAGNDGHGTGAPAPVLSRLMARRSAVTLSLGVVPILSPNQPGAGAGLDRRHGLRAVVQWFPPAPIRQRPTGVGPVELPVLRGLRIEAGWPVARAPSWVVGEMTPEFLMPEAEAGESAAGESTAERAEPKDVLDADPGPRPDSSAGAGPSTPVETKSRCGEGERLLWLLLPEGEGAP